MKTLGCAAVFGGLSSEKWSGTHGIRGQHAEKMAEIHERGEPFSAFAYQAGFAKPSTAGLPSSPAQPNTPGWNCPSPSGNTWLSLLNADAEAGSSDRRTLPGTNA